jgi:hypothetical protein
LFDQRSFVYHRHARLNLPYRIIAILLLGHEPAISSSARVIIDSARIPIAGRIAVTLPLPYPPGEISDSRPVNFTDHPSQWAVWRLEFSVELDMGHP